MNKELNIGDYVRTKNGIIGKIVDINLGDFQTRYELDNSDEFHYEYKNDIIKSSPNIIDLIEVGDILKLRDNKEYQQVQYIEENKLYLTGYIQFELQKSKTELQEEIEWVITHEQIESMKYEV